MKSEDNLNDVGQSLTLTPMQREVCAMLSRGFSLEEAARHLKISESTLHRYRSELLRRFDLRSTVELRKLTIVLFPSDTVHASTAPMIRHEVSHLPNVTLDPRGALGAACRARFDGRTLREVADYLRECESAPGSNWDAFPEVIARHTGTIGAKQAFLAALAAENGREDVQLLVACCEMQLSHFGDRVDWVLAGRRLQKFPLTTCWLRYKGRRLQICEPRQASLQAIELVTEIPVRSEQLAAERVRLYQVFSADWCRAMEVEPSEFARQRASLLKISAGTSIFEDLLGFSLPPEFLPKL